jgi:hypothetical protein
VYYQLKFICTIKKTYGPFITYVTQVGEGGGLPTVICQGIRCYPGEEGDKKSFKIVIRNSIMASLEDKFI